MKTSAVFIIVLLAWACQQADSMKLIVEIVPKLAPTAESEVSPGNIGENIFVTNGKPGLCPGKTFSLSG